VEGVYEGGLNLARPVLVTSVGSRAARALKAVRDELPGSTPDLSLAMLVDTVRGDDAADAGGLRLVTPDGLSGLIVERLQQQALSRVDRVSWIALAWIDDDEADQSRSTLTRIQRDIIPCAAHHYSNGKPLVLTVVLVDNSHAHSDALQAALQALANPPSDQDSGPSMQIYVLRAQRTNGFLLGPAELEGYAELVTLGLVLTNTVGVGSGLANLVLAAQAIDGNAGGTHAGGLRLFGRVAVQRIRSLTVVTAERCAETRLHEFAARMVSRSAQVGLLGWRPAEVLLTRPELSQADKGRIGDRIRGGVPLELKGPPSILVDRLSYLQHVRDDVDRWGVAVQGWRRDVRVHLDTVQRDIRASSALERTRGRAQVDDEIITLWSELARESPGPYIREFLDIQRKRWVEERGELAGQVDGVRSTAPDDPRDSLAEPLAHLERELARRANHWLMALFALVSLGIGGWLSWQSMDGLGGIPFVAAALQAWSDAVRIVAVMLILVVVVLVVFGALLATNTRWKSAYFDIERLMAALIATEASALEREIATVDRHWYLKVISSSLHHIADRTHRLAYLERQLQSVSAPAASASSAALGLTRLVPDNAQAGADERSLLAELPSAGALLRTPSVGTDWIRGDVRRWTHTAREVLQYKFAELLADVARASETRTAAAVRQILAEWDQPGQSLALSYLSPGLAGQAIDPPRARLVFASGSLATLLASMPDASGTAEVIHVDQPSDELLLFLTQAGLEAAAVLA
jgi:hypothetical protein